MDEALQGGFNCQVPLCTRTLNHVAVDNPRFQKQGYGRMLQSERGEGVEWIALKFKKKKSTLRMVCFNLKINDDFCFP